MENPYEDTTNLFVDFWKYLLCESTPSSENFYGPSLKSDKKKITNVKTTLNENSEKIIIINVVTKHLLIYKGKKMGSA